MSEQPHHTHAGEKNADDHCREYPLLGHAADIAERKAERCRRSEAESAFDSSVELGFGLFIFGSQIQINVDPWLKSCQLRFRG